MTGALERNPANLGVAGDTLDVDLQGGLAFPHEQIRFPMTRLPAFLDGRGTLPDRDPSRNMKPTLAPGLAMTPLGVGPDQVGDEVPAIPVHPLVDRLVADGR